MPKWRKPSIFGPGHRMPLDRNQLARFVWLVRNDRRHGRLSATGEDVAIELVKMLGDDGRLDPNHATISDRVGCDISTTRRCLKRSWDGAGPALGAARPYPGSLHRMGTIARFVGRVRNIDTGWVVPVDPEPLDQ